MAFWRKEKEQDKKLRQQRKEVRKMKEWREEFDSSHGEQVPSVSRKDKGW